MGRSGITFSDVAKAANRLSAAGLPVTNDDVRRLIGSGSMTTIATFMREWRAMPERDPASAPLDEENATEEQIATLVRALAGRLHQRAQVDFEMERARHEEDVAVLRTELEAEKQRSSDLLHASQTVTEELERVRTALSATQQREQQLRVMEATLRAEAQGAQQRLADRAAEIHALTYHLDDARAQFGRYQEAVAEQRQEDRAAHDARVAMLETACTRANEELILLRAKAAAAETQAQLGAQLQAQAIEDLTGSRAAQSRAELACVAAEQHGHEVGARLAVVQDQLAASIARAESALAGLSLRDGQIAELREQVSAAAQRASAAQAELTNLRSQLARVAPRVDAADTTPSGQ